MSIVVILAAVAAIVVLILLVAWLVRAARPVPVLPAWAAAQQVQEDRPEVVRLLLAGRKIDAVRVVRQRTGLGLKEAKEAVEAIEDEERIDPRRRRR